MVVSGQALPTFLRDHRPDLIARRGEERLVIELKTPPQRLELLQDWVDGLAELRRGRAAER
jgi:Holliday junction resolvase